MGVIPCSASSLVALVKLNIPMNSMWKPPITECIHEVDKTNLVDTRNDNFQFYKNSILITNNQLGRRPGEIQEPQLS